MFFLFVLLGERFEGSTNIFHLLRRYGFPFLRRRSSFWPAETNELDSVPRLRGYVFPLYRWKSSFWLANFLLKRVHKKSGFGSRSLKVKTKIRTVCFRRKCIESIKYPKTKEKLKLPKTYVYIFFRLSGICRFAWNICHIFDNALPKITLPYK